MNVVILIST